MKRRRNSPGSASGSNGPSTHPMTSSASSMASRTTASSYSSVTSSCASSNKRRLSRKQSPVEDLSPSKSGSEERRMRTKQKNLKEGHAVVKPRPQPDPIPRLLYVTSPNGHHHCSGLYKLIPGRH